MMRWSAIALLVGLCTTLCADGPTVRRIERLRPLHVDTVLVAGGKAEAIVAAPASDAQLAGVVIARIKSLTGVDLPLREDQTVTDDDFRRANVIVIGNFSTNKVAERLYTRRFTYEDYIYPGIAGKTADEDGPPVTGYVIRTVHDPFALGRNFIVLAGSEPAGTAEAVEQFAESLNGKKDLIAPHTVKVRIGTKQLMKPSYTKNDIPQEQVDRLIEQIRRTVTNMRRLQNNIWFQSESYAMGYQLTGNSCWAKVFKGQMEILAENLDRFNSMPNNYIEGMFGLVPAWDWMEETPFFSDEERLKFTNVVLEVACRNEEAWKHYLNNPRAEALSSHGGDRVQSWRYAGLYFSKYYGINRHWLTMTDEAIKWMNETPRSCDGYRLGCGHATRLTQYARRTGDMGYFESGSCRQQTDLVMTCTDNQGRAVTVGDHDRWDTKIDREWHIGRLMGEAAWFYKDSSYQWFMQDLAYHEWPFDAFSTGATPKRPDRLVGLNVLPVHKNIYENMRLDDKTTVRTFEPAPPMTVPLEETFDKLTLREAIDPQKQYLLLDGISGMDHGHIDGNSIIRFSDLDRMWLVDVGWTRCYPRDHNMLLIVKDGESKGPQKVTRLDAAADLDTVAFTKTTIPGYNDMDWSRHLIWLKGEGVIALDRVTAQATGDYTLRRRWRCPGDAKLTDGGLLVTQAGPRFKILNADGSTPRMRLVVLDDTNNSMLTYPHMNPQRKMIIYDNVIERRFARGESYTFQSLFYAGSDKVRREYGIERVDDSAVRITSPRGAMVMGLEKGNGMFLLAGARFCAAQAAKLGDPPIFKADKPVDIEYDAATGKGAVIAKVPTRLTLPAASAEGKLDDKSVAGDLKAGMVSIEVPAGKHSLAFAPSADAAAQLSRLADSYSATPPKPPATQTRSSVRGLKKVWETSTARPSRGGKTDPRKATGEILDMTLGDLDGDDKPEIVTVDEDGAVTVLGLDGKVRWRQADLDRASAVAIAVFAKKPHVVVGCHKPPYLFVFDAKGTRLEGEWVKVNDKDPFKGIAAPLRYVAAADMDGDGSDEVLAANFPALDGQVPGCCYCYDKAGRMRWWRQPVNHELATGTVAPLKPGGPMVFIAGGTFNSCVGLNAAGAECFNAMASHRLTVIHVADVDGDKNNEVLIGGHDNYVHLHEADGKRRWMHNVGGAVSGIAVADINGDRKAEIIVSTAELNQNVFALTSEGERLWGFKAGEEVNALAVGNVDSKSGPEIVVGTDGGDVIVLDGKGKRVAGAAVSGSVAKLALCPSIRSGRSEIVVATKDGRVSRLRAGAN
ncbi:MAG: VCBS repeat-containing protein [Planctomycetota bacterium]